MREGGDLVEDGGDLVGAGGDLPGPGVAVTGAIGTELGYILDAPQKIRPVSVMNLCENTFPPLTSSRCVCERAASPERNDGLVCCRKNSRYRFEQLPSKSSLRVCVRV